MTPKPSPSPAARWIGAPTPLTHASRVVFPADGLTKGDVAAYYDRVADRMTPYLEHRLVSIVRAPEGIGRDAFFQRRPMKGMADGLVAIGEADDAYIAVEGRQGLRAAAQFGAIEFHGWMERFDKPDHPDRLVIDLDPAPGLAFREVRAAARDIRDRLRAVGLESWPLITGGRGVHVVAPLDRTATTAEVEAFARAFAQGLSEREPGRFIANMSKAQRAGRIFVDWMRNSHRATSILPWSLRARPGAPVAVPLSWPELARIRSSAACDIHTAPRRSDPWTNALATRQTIPAGAPA